MSEELDDEVLERALRVALTSGDTDQARILRAEARRRFAGIFGLPAWLIVAR
jgi:hypothetical protein